MSEQLVLPKPAIHGTLERVEFSETKTQNDPEPCVRLYCTQHGSAFSLQIRGRVPLGKGNKPRNLIATAMLSWEELVQIAEYVRKIQAEKVADHYDELRTENHPDGQL